MKRLLSIMALIGALTLTLTLQAQQLPLVSMSPAKDLVTIQMSLLTANGTSVPWDISAYSPSVHTLTFTFRQQPSAISVALLCSQDGGQTFGVTLGTSTSTTGGTIQDTTHVCSAIEFSVLSSTGSFIIAPVYRGSITSTGGGGGGSTVLPCVANAAPPTDTEGASVPCSTDLSGNTRIIAAPLVYNSTPSTLTNGQSGALQINANQDLKVAGSGTVGATAPIGAAFTGASDSSGNLIGDVNCPFSITYDASTNGSTQLLAVSGSKNYIICGYEMFSGGTVNVSLVAGTGTACASTAAANPSVNPAASLAAAMPLTPAWEFTAQTGKISAWPTHGFLFSGGAGNEVCIKTSAGVAVQAQIFYR